MVDWPGWATETVEIRPPDAAWQQRGEQERQLLGPWLVAEVEHVGSTAVPGLAAKPILDLQAAVPDLRSAPRITATLEPHRWHYVEPELDDRPWRRFFVKVSDGHRVAHLHVMTLASARWHEQLAFRDALRADARLMESYAAIKSALAAEHADDREAYSAAKSFFIRAVLDPGRTAEGAHNDAP